MKRMLGVALLAFAMAALSVGCGPKYNKVECKVTLDGTPVDGATVTLVKDSKDEQTSGGNPTGQTENGGVVKLKTGDKEGVLPGKYKVLVTKIAKPKGVDPGGDPLENMKKAMEQNKGGGPGGRPGGGPPGGGRPGGGAGGGNAPTGMSLANELPDKYSKVDSTDLTIEVPTSGVVELKLSK